MTLPKVIQSTTDFSHTFNVWGKSSIFESKMKENRVEKMEDSKNFLPVTFESL